MNGKGAYNNKIFLHIKLTLMGNINAQQLVQYHKAEAESSEERLICEKRKNRREISRKDATIVVLLMIIFAYRFFDIIKPDESASLREKVKSLENKVSSLREQISTMVPQSVLDEKIQHIASLEIDLHNIRKDYETQIQQQTSEETTNEELVQEKVEKEARIQELTAEIAQRMIRITNLEQEIQNLTNQLSALDSSKSEQAERIAILIKQISILREERNELEKKNQKLNAKISKDDIVSMAIPMEADALFGKSSWKLTKIGIDQVKKATLDVVHEIVENPEKYRDGALEFVVEGNSDRLKASPRSRIARLAKELNTSVNYLLSIKRAESIAKVVTNAIEDSKASILKVLPEIPKVKAIGNGVSQPRQLTKEEYHEMVQKYFGGSPDSPKIKKKLRKGNEPWNRYSQIKSTYYPSSSKIQKWNTKKRGK